MFRKSLQRKIDDLDTKISEEIGSLYRSQLWLRKELEESGVIVSSLMATTRDDLKVFDRSRTIQARVGNIEEQLGGIAIQLSDLMEKLGNDNSTL